MKQIFLALAIALVLISCSSNPSTNTGVATMELGSSKFSFKVCD